MADPLVVEQGRCLICSLLCMSMLRASENAVQVCILSTLLLGVSK